MSKIKITILGTTAGVPTKERAHSAIYFSYTDAEEYVCLFDCGEGTQRQILFAGQNPLKIDDLFITHWHGDHCLGLPGLIDTMGFEGKKNGINIYSPETRRVKRCVGFINYTMGRVNVKPYRVPSRGKKVFKVMGQERFRIFSIPVKHSIPSVAYAFVEKDKVVIDPDKLIKQGLPLKDRSYNALEKGGIINMNGRRVKLEDVSTVNKGKKVVYSGDSEVCDNLRRISEGADLLIQDCTYFERQKEKAHKHANLPDIIDMVRTNNIDKVILTHISRKYRDLSEIAKLIEKYNNVVLAEDLMKIEL